MGVAARARRVPRRFSETRQGVEKILRTPNSELPTGKGAKVR